MFGIPWPGLVAIVAIVGGLFYAYKEQELKIEAKRIVSSKEINELRKIIHNLKSRIEHLEANSSSSTKKEAKKEVPIDDIEIKDEYYSEGEESTRKRVQN